jgi:aryl-alcohol dehydrogenase-like predicted oxidoreductase
LYDAAWHTSRIGGSVTEIIGIRKRLVKRLGISISEMGFGAWGIGGHFVGTSTPIDGREALGAYLGAGGNFIDTAAIYGESEKTIGTTLAELGAGDSVYVATKTKYGDVRETVPLIRRDVENSLRNLRRDHVDLLYLHVPPEDDGTIALVLDECERLKAEGRIRAIGASIKGPAVTDNTVALCRKYVDTGRVDVIQLVYSILRQKNIAAIDYAFRNDVGIVVRTSMESGFLTGKFQAGTRFPADDHRSRWNGNIDAIIREVDRVREAQLKPPYETVGQLAIRFALVPEGVTSVIVGAKNAAQQRANLRALALAAPTDAAIRWLVDEFADRTQSFNPSSAAEPR